MLFGRRGVLFAGISGMSGVFGRNLVRRGLVAGMVFERVVFMGAVFVRAVLGGFPQRFRNIGNGPYWLGRECRRLGDVSRTVTVVLGMRLMIVLVIVIMGMLVVVMVVVMMRRVLVVVGVIGVMSVIAAVLVVMAFLAVSISGLVQSLCRRLQA